MKLIRKIVFPFSLLYALVVRVRNYLYDSNIKASSTFRLNLICIGNLSVGGTGKTPMAEYLIRQLKDEFKVALLSRGYKRKTKGFILANELSTAEKIGDEPFQIYSKFPEISVAVDADRRNGIALLEKEVNPDVILLDDAFQHRKVKAGLNILLTVYGKLYCNDWYLPTGNLRDSRREAKRADIIVVTKCPATILEAERKSIVADLKPNVDQQVLFSTLVYDKWLLGNQEPIALKTLMDKKVTLITGIADAQPLVLYLEQQGLSFEHLSFSDHHFFSAKELENLNKKEVVLTTEKDFVRLKDGLNALYYISIRHKFVGDDSKRIKAALNAFMKQDF